MDTAWLDLLNNRGHLDLLITELRFPRLESFSQLIRRVGSKSVLHSCPLYCCAIQLSRTVSHFSLRLASSLSFPHNFDDFSSLITLCLPFPSIYLSLPSLVCLLSVGLPTLNIRSRDTVTSHPPAFSRVLGPPKRSLRNTMSARIWKNVDSVHANFDARKMILSQGNAAT